MRVHSLPRSKRSAGNLGEGAVLAHRHAVVGRTVLGAGAEVLEINGQPWGPRSRGYDAHPRLAPIIDAQDRRFARTLLDPEDSRLTTFTARWTHWPPHNWRARIAHIAADLGRSLWFNPKRRTVLAPYDGGMDVIAASRRQRDVLIERFGPWMSARPDML